MALQRRYTVKDVWTLIPVFILAFVFSLECSSNIWRISVGRIDSNVFQYIARVMQNNGMPYKDVFDHKGPLIYILDWLGMLISVRRGIWVIELITLFVAFEVMYQTARLLCNRVISFLILVISVAPLFTFFQGGNLVEEYALPFIAISLYIFLDFFINGIISRVRLIICGFSFGAIFLLRINMASLWAVMCMGVLIQCILAKKFEPIPYFIVNFLLGFCIIIVPVFLWLAIRGAFQAFIDDYFVFNFLYIEDGRNIFERLWCSITFIMRVPLVPVSLFLSVLIAIQERKYVNTLFIVFMGINLLSVAISGRRFWHYYMIMVPMFVYPLSVLGNWAKGKTKVITTAAMILMLTVSIPAWFGGAKNAIDVYNTRRESSIPKNAKQLIGLVRKYTKEDDTILAYGNDTYIYNMSHLFASSKYAYQNDTVFSDMWGKKDEFYRDLEEKPPKLVVVNTGVPMQDALLEMLAEKTYQELSAIKNYKVYILPEGQ